MKDGSFKINRLILCLIRLIRLNSIVHLVLNEIQLNFMRMCKISKWIILKIIMQLKILRTTMRTFLAMTPLSLPKMKKLLMFHSSDLGN